MGDLPAAFALITACEEAEYGAPDTLVDDLREAWQGHDLATDAVVVHAPDHQLVGFATVAGQAQMDAEVYVHPAYRGQGLAAYLEGWIDARAWARAAPVADHAPVVLDRVVNGTNDAAGQQLRAAGYTLVRHHWRMLIDLALPLPEPVWPAGIRVRTAIRDQDERAGACGAGGCVGRCRGPYADPL
jgi:GNAT superfamily N-acetyltransferase